jgi:hypothetical protein
MIGLGVFSLALGGNKLGAPTILGIAALVIFGLFQVIAGLFEGESAAPETASGKPVSPGGTILGLDDPPPPPPPPTSETADHAAENTLEKAVHERLAEIVRETPFVTQEPYACLEMLCRKLDDGPEVRAIVAAVRQGTPATLREQSLVMDEILVKHLAQQIADNQGIAPELALWAVDTWRAIVVRHAA